MVHPLLKEFFVPGTFHFFFLTATLAAILLLRRKHQGRSGRVLLAAVVVLYWLFSMPISAVPLIRVVTPDYPAVQSRADAGGATAIVVLSGGMNSYHSRGAVFHAASREHSLRVLEAARVYRVLDRPWVIVSGRLFGGGGASGEVVSEAAMMRLSLMSMGVPGERIVEEPESRNTRDHSLLVPPLLKSHGIRQFVLVTSRQHMARALRVFRAAGWDPVPSSPEFYVPDGTPFEPFLPSDAALDASRTMMYDLLGLVYYKARGWI